MKINLPKTAKESDAEELWDADSIQAVIRAANMRGICPQAIFQEERTYRKYGKYAPTVRID